MCGRIVWRFDPLLQQWIKSFLEDDEAYAAATRQPAVAEDRYNITPGSTIPVARRPDGPVLEMRKWAYPLDGRYVFNTRIETAFTSPMWRRGIRDGRCVIPITGFYEWRDKAPFYIHRRDGGPLLLAGVSDHREHGGEDVPVCSIVTCPPNDLMSRLHDRMPAILEGAAVDAWLDPGTPLEVVRELVQPAGDVLEAYPVDRAVNNGDNDGPGLIRRLPTLGEPLA